MTQWFEIVSIYIEGQRNNPLSPIHVFFLRQNFALQIQWHLAAMSSILESERKCGWNSKLIQSLLGN